MKTFEHDGKTIRVNDTGDDVFLASDPLTRDVIETLISDLTSLPPAVRKAIDHPMNMARHKKAMADSHKAIVSTILKQHADGLLLLSPIHFTSGTDERVTNRVAQQILDATPLGRTMHRDLGAVGLYAFINKLKNKRNRVVYQNTLHMIMASLCVAVSGMESIGKLPPQGYLAWLRFFRNPEDTRWKQEVWNTRRDVSYQCLRELTHAYARLTGCQQVTSHSMQRRTSQANHDGVNVRALHYWMDIKRNPPEHIQPWLNMFTAWRSSEPAFSASYRQMFMHIVKWLDSHFTPVEIADVAVFHSRPHREPGFAEYLIRRRQQAAKPEAGTTFVQTIAYAKRFSDFLVSELTVQNQQKELPVHPLVTASDVQLSKNATKREGKASRPNEAKSRPLPMRFYQLARKILEKGEHGWPGNSGICAGTVVRADGVSEKIYCPVLPTLFLSLFHLPLRVGQMKRLDSGEGDFMRFDGASQAWRPNEGPNAGYWRRQAQGSGDHGYARQTGSEAKSITGFFINTNKTGQPYVIPWQNEQVHKLFHELRLWQERNNPCKAPIGPQLYIDGVEDAEEGKLEDYPDIFPLFRLPVERGSRHQGCPPNSRKASNFWNLLMAEVERRWNESHSSEDHVQIVKRQAQTKYPTSSRYNPHGLRVAGLTLMFHQKVPIEVISKLVAGHKTILMTLYYLKFDVATVHQALDEAAQTREAVEAEAWTRELKSAKYEAAQRKAAFIHEDGLRAATSMDSTDKVCWSDTGIGICPWDSKRCGDGGPCIRKDKRPGGGVYNVHGPVKGGERDCVLCRHFISGPAWSTPLWLYGTKLTRQFASKSERITELEEELGNLHAQHQDATEASVRQRLSKEIERRRGEADAVTVELEIVAERIWNTQRLLEACHKVERVASSDDGKIGSSSALVALDGDSVVEYFEVSEFEQAAIITAGSRVYPILHDAEAEAARDRFLDAIMWRSGNQPLTFAPLDPATKRRGLDAFSRLLLERVEREEIAALASGALRLQDLHLEGEVAAAITAAIGSPISVAGAGRPALTGDRAVVA